MTDTSDALPALEKRNGAMETNSVTPLKALSGSQTLIRGLDVLEAVAGGATTLAAMDRPGFGGALLFEIPFAVALVALIAIRTRH